MPIEAPPDPTTTRHLYGPYAIAAPTPATTDGNALGFATTPLQVFATWAEAASVANPVTDLRTFSLTGIPGSPITTVTPDPQTGACKWFGPVGFFGVLWLRDPTTGERWPVIPSDLDIVVGTGADWDTLAGRPLFGAWGDTIEAARAAIQAMPDSYVPTKASVGLGNVANLAPVDMPLSRAQAEAIEAAQTATEDVALDRRNHRGTQGAETVDWANAATLAAFRAAVLAVTGEGTVEPPPPPPPATGVPTQVSASGSNSEPFTITLTWDVPTDTGGKTVAGYIASRNNPTYETADLGAAARSFTFTNFAAGTPYTVGVRAVYTDGSTSPVVNEDPITFTGSTTPTPSDPGTGTFRIMPMGDSLTAVDASALGYKGVLLNSLVAAGRSIDYVGSKTSTGPAGLRDPNHEGIPGAQNSTFLGQYLETVTAGAKVSTYQPNIVTYLVGVNDLWSSVPVATALTRMRAVFDQIYAARPTVKIIVCRIPLMGVAAEVNRAAYNDGVSQVVTDYSAAGRAITLADLSGTLASSDLQSDGIHWTATGHNKVAAALLPIVQSVISGTVVTPPPSGGGTGTGGTTGSAPMPYPNHGVGMYTMIYSVSTYPSVATTPSNVNNLRLAFFFDPGPNPAGSGSDGGSFGQRLRDLRARGVRIIASFGGAHNSVNISNTTAIVNAMMTFSNNVCPLDGWDIDLEGASLPSSAPVVQIAQTMRANRGANWATTMAPNGSNVDQYLPVAVALNNAGLLSAFGQQFYDAPVDDAAMKGRLSQYVSRGLPISKYELGMMSGPTSYAPLSSYWDVPTMIARLNSAKAAYPTLGGAYYWERSRSTAQQYSDQVGGIVKSW